MYIFFQILLVGVNNPFSLAWHAFFFPDSAIAGEDEADSGEEHVSVAEALTPLVALESSPEQLRGSHLLIFNVNSRSA